MKHVSVASVKVSYAEVTSASIQMVSSPQQLRDFMDALTAKMRGVKFLYRQQHEVYVYMDSCPYTLGYIGYADYSGGVKYAVFSRTIENRKFNSGKQAYNMLVSINIDVAVRNALANLRPYSVTEMASVDIEKLRVAYNMKGSDLRNSRSKSHRILSDHTALAAELRELLRNGYKFGHADFAEQAAAYVEVSDHLHVMEMQETRHFFVRVVEDWRGQVFQVQALDHIKGSYAMDMRVAKDFPCTDTPVAEVNEGIFGKVSVLSMLSADGYVAGVGMKLTEDTFYVQL